MNRLTMVRPLQLDHAPKSVHELIKKSSRLISALLGVSTSIMIALLHRVLNTKIHA